MRDHFERFTERARRALNLAQEEAQRLNHSYIGPVHLFLGLVREGDGVAAKALAACGVTLQAARRAVEQIAGREDHIVRGEIGLTPGAKQVIERAVEESLRLNHDYIGTEHILLGLLRSDDDDLARVLETLDVVPDAVRADAALILGQAASALATAPPSRSSPPAGQRARPAPQGRFVRFDERARKVLSLAQEEAHRFNHSYIGTEHLLLGVVQDGDGVAARVLGNLGVELTRVRSAVEFIIGRGDRIVLGEIGLTPRAKKVIELTVEESRLLHHHYVGTEHLLLGLIREGEGIAAGVLESLGVSLDRARSETLRVLGERAAGGPADGDQTPEQS